VLADNAPVDCVPLTALVPVQPPLALQEVALVADQLKVADVPLAIVLGLLAKVIVGAGCVTDTVATCAAVPPLPVQLKE
jgi:hypothetical protein